MAVGTAVHATHAALSLSLNSLADDWADGGGDRTSVLDRAELVTATLDGVWAAVIALFLGVPFVLVGLSVALSRRWPRWFGTVSVVGGAGSLVIGAVMFGGADLYPSYVFFAVVLSIWMVALGVLLWRVPTPPS